jgi:hypothetical protein
MTDQKLQQHINDWLTKNHTLDTHAAILGKVLAVGKPSKPWVETIQRYVQGVAFHMPERGDIKRACRVLLENR